MVFVSSLVLFSVAWLIHLAWWRTRPPTHPSKTLVLVFGLTPCLALFVWWATGPHAIRLLDIPAILLFYGGATLCYFITYTGIEETSPSLTILRALERSGEEGCDKEMLRHEFSRQHFVARRLNSLVREGLIVPSGDGHVVNKRGLRVARLSAFLGRIFNIHETV